MGVVSGALKVKGEQETFGTYTKATIVIDVVDGEYVNPISFDVSGKALEALAPLSVGDEVEVEYSLRGRLWTNKEGKDVYFNTLNAWKIKAGLPF